MVAFFESCAVGVGQRPRPGSIVSGTDGRSTDNVRPDGITFCDKVTFNLVKGSCVDVSKNIFSNNVKRSVPDDLLKCPAPHAVAVSLGVGSTVALAWVAACDDIAAAVEVEISHVIVDWRVGPVLPKDGLTELVLLAEGNGPKRSGSFESETEPSHAREEVERFDFIHRPPSLPVPRRNSLRHFFCKRDIHNDRAHSSIASSVGRTRGSRLEVSLLNLSNAAHLADCRLALVISFNISFKRRPIFVYMVSARRS